jgi:uncharacterized protein YfaS (alpha-2-macroglobulin family)
MDFAVPEQSITAAVGYLERQFKAPKDVSAGWQLNEMAFMHFVLAELGQGDPGRASTLYDVRERLGYYGRAYLAMALDAMAHAGEPDRRVQTLLDDLLGAAQLSATGASWHEAQNEWQTWNTDTRSTAIIVGAFARLDPDRPLVEQSVRWLMSARRAARWATTQENAWAIIGLTDWMVASGELEGDYSWDVSLNSEPLGAGTFGPMNRQEKVELVTDLSNLLRDEANILHFDRNNASGQLYYTTHLRYSLDALAVDARDRGVVIDRRSELDGRPVTGARVGDVISVTTTIIAPRDLHHLLAR